MVCSALRGTAPPWLPYSIVWRLAQLIKDGVVIDLPYVTGGDALQRFGRANEQSPGGMEMLGQTLEEPGAIGLAKVDRDISAEDNVKGAERGKGFEEIELAKPYQGTQLVFDAPLRAHSLKIAGDALWGEATGYFYLVVAPITRLSQRRSGDVCPQDGATIGPNLTGQFFERHGETVDFLAR